MAFSLVRSKTTKSAGRWRPLTVSLVALVFIAASGLFHSALANTSIQVSSVTINEDAGSAIFTISLPSSVQSTRIDYSTADGTAIAPTDYTSTTGGPVSINPGETISVKVPIIYDPAVDPTETFTLKVNDLVCDCAVRSAYGTATIVDNDMPAPLPPPPPPPPPTPTPPPIVHPPVHQITPPAAPTTSPPPPPTVVITNPDPSPSAPNPLPSVQVNVPVGPGPTRSAFVRSVPDPTQLHLTMGTMVKSSLLALLLVLLILFPSDLFNSTLASNYDEVVGWFRLRRLRGVTNKLRRLPSGLALLGFAVAGAILNSQLSPDFGMNKASLALFTGIFITLAATSIVYDLARAIYLHRRFGLVSKLRAHVIGLIVGAILVMASRLAHFLPGYFYGLFTALVFSRQEPSDEQDGEGLAVASISLLALAAAGWFLWIPVKAAASHAGASFLTLTLDAALSSLWVTALMAIVFGLAPIRFFYGEQVKKWSKPGWYVIYILGIALFAFTLIQGNVYSTSKNTTLASVMVLFIGFGLFSTLFWGYFRYRHLWRHRPDAPSEAH